MAEEHYEQSRPLKPSSMFKSASKRAPEDKQLTPAPDSYHVSTDWTKRTFNLLFTKV
jgi:hypothetical protein